MITRTALGSLLMIFVLALPATAEGTGDIQAYFSASAARVKATDSPSEKRDILNGSLCTMVNALDVVQRSSSLSDGDRIGVDRIRGMLQEKQDELAGRNGYARVPDGQLNAFSQYVVQDMEQADEIVTISLVTLLLIIILVVLLV